MFFLFIITLRTLRNCSAWCKALSSASSTLWLHPFWPRASQHTNKERKAGFTLALWRSQRYCFCRQSFFFSFFYFLMWLQLFGVKIRSPLFKRIFSAIWHCILQKHLLTTDKNLIFGSTALHDWLHCRPLTVPRLRIWFVTSIQSLI